jgi:GntR family transcriptional repressor for pyruvate dehydrogenase complex
VREALRLLASQNLIITTRGVAGGSFVVHPSPDQLTETLATGLNLLRSSRLVSPRDLLEARLFVEVPSTGLAARRRSDEHLEALQATLFDPQTAELEAMTAIHSAFHEAIADACGNPLLALIAKPLYRVANVREVLQRFGRDFWVRVDADHRAILAAVAHRRPEDAEGAMARHIEDLRIAFDEPVEPSADEMAVSVAGVV